MIVLGTAQLGMDYGIANRTGRPSEGTARAILSAAFAGGVRWLDTAQGYGEAEELIARYQRDNPRRRFCVVSKLDRQIDASKPDQVLGAVESSRGRFEAPLDALLLHDPGQIESLADGLGRVLGDCIDRGLIRAAGVSTYTPAEFERALSLSIVSVIEAPFSALDRRLLVSGALERARRAGKRVLLRSLFLQGLLLVDPAQLPKRLAFAREALLDWRALCARRGLRPSFTALRYAAQAVPDAGLVVGCETPEQLAENLAIASSPSLDAATVREIEALPIPAERVLNPNLWPR